MKRALPSIVLILLAIGAARFAPQARGEDACCPATVASAQTQTVAAADALPEGHPPVGAKADQELPAGHPPIGGGQGQMPAGHPPIGGQGQMPPGHPSIDGMDTGPAVGTIAVKAVQGTQDAEPVGAAPIKVELYQQGKAVQTLEATLDESGVAMIEGIQFTGVVQPVVSMQRGGATFQAVGQPMAASRPDQMVRLTVYETSHEQPGWTIGMRHVLIRRTESGVNVTEMVQVANPADRAWVGPEADPPAAETDAEPQGPVVLRLPLPEGATNVQPGAGFDACCTTVEQGAILSRAAMMPGQTQFGYTYDLPADAAGQVTLDIRTPAEVGHLMVFVPDEGTSVATEGLQQGQSMRGKAMEVRIYQAAKLKPTDPASITIGGLSRTPEQGDAAVPGASGPAAADAAGMPTTKLVAGVGGGAILVGVCAALVLRSPKKAA